MKRFFARLAVGALLLVIGFFSGRLFQHATNGFHFQVLAEEEYGSQKDPVRWRNVSESVGPQFMIPSTTMIEYRGRTIYKAQSVFQEGVPFATNIKTSDKHIDWDDGELRFHLTIEEIKKGEPTQR